MNLRWLEYAHTFRMDSAPYPCFKYRKARKSSAEYTASICECFPREAGGLNQPDSPGGVPGAFKLQRNRVRQINHSKISRRIVSFHIWMDSLILNPTEGALDKPVSPGAPLLPLPSWHWTGVCFMSWFSTYIDTWAKARLMFGLNYQELTLFSPSDHPPLCLRDKTISLTLCQFRLHLKINGQSWIKCPPSPAPQYWINQHRLHRWLWKPNSDDAADEIQLTLRQLDMR